MSKKKIKIEHTVLYSELKNLLIAAYYLGQETGLKGHSYTSKTAQKQRENIIDLILLLHE